VATTNPMKGSGALINWESDAVNGLEGELELGKFEILKCAFHDFTLQRKRMGAQGGFG
jgi:hypothetical protein